MQKCLCGCGRPVQSVQNRKFFDGSRCRVRYNTQQLLVGCLPRNRVGFAKCTNCGREFLYWKNSKRKTCSQFYGTKCNHRQHSKTLKGNCHGGGNKIGSARAKRTRMPHITTYCIQDTGQCRHWCQGFDIDFISAGCWGHRYKEGIECYERP